MNRAPVDGDAAAHRATTRRDRMLSQVFDTLRLDVLAGGRVIVAAVKLHDVGLLGLAEPLRRLGDGVEGWLDIRGRTGDDVEDFADGGLIFERFLDLARASFHLVEQPHIFDRNYRLIGEGGGEFNLLVRKWANLMARQYDHANRAAFAQEGNAENASIAAQFLRVAISEVRVRENVGTVDDVALKQCTAGELTAVPEY